jgi:hypothetical protein
MSPASHRALVWIGLLGLCAAYLQGGLNKLLDFHGAIGEATHFDLPLPPLAAAVTIMLELGASATILTRRLRWPWRLSHWRRPAAPTISLKLRKIRVHGGARIAVPSFRSFDARKVARIFASIRRGLRSDG